MKRVRTKLIGLFVTVALLPALPLSLFMKNLLDRTLEVGINPRVDAALESAVTITKDAYERHWQDVQEAAQVLAKLASNQNKLSVEALRYVDVDMLEIFTHEGEFTYFVSVDSTVENFKTDGKAIAALIPNYQTQLLNNAVNPEIVKASAPIRSKTNAGFVVATRYLPSDFVKGSENIKEVRQIFLSLDYVRDDLRRGFILAFVTVYVPILAVFVGVGLLLSCRITQRLETLAEATQKVAGGDLDHRIEVSSKDEIGQLVKSFNQMVGDLKSKQEKLIYLEKMAAWREIARVLAHEIKNPLTPIQLTIQELRDKYTGQDAKFSGLLNECTAIISDEVNNLRVLAQEFSSFARMPELKPIRGDLNELVGDITKLYATYNVHVKLDSLPEFEFDPEKIRRVLINIMDNAVSASGADGKIAITSGRNANCARVCIWNSGPPISEEHLEMLFEPYFSTKRGGIGLGLAVVKHVAEEHGGQVSVQNVRDGVEFCIELPVHFDKF